MFTDVAVQMGVNDAGAAQGVVFLDVNNDGFLDIYLVNNANPNRLWLNNNGTSFTDVSSAWGVNNNNAGRGCSAVDFNNDGLIDIIVGNYNQPMILYRNTGSAFENFTANANLNITSWGGSINWFDFNNDGKVDFLFANDGVPYHYNYLFKNENLSTFTNVAFLAGIIDSTSTLCLASGDYDNDGDIDIFCGTQTNSGLTGTGFLYRNNGNGTFTDVTLASGIITNYYTWGAEWGDYNNDGYLDLFLANSNGYNQLYKNNGNGTFSEVATTMGVNDQGQSYSCGWADFDNDGDLDLYVARGQGYSDKMYRNDGTIFTDVTAQVGMGDLRHSSCVSWGDFNNDGFLDLYLNNNGTENRLYQNNAGNSNNWLILRLQGVNSNRSAIGSRAIVKTGTLTQMREVEGGSGGKGQNSLPLEFGIGSASIIDTLIIKWTSGLIQTFTNVQPHRIINIIEGQSIGIRQINENVPQNFKLEQNYPNPFNPSTKIRIDVPATNLSFPNASIGNPLIKLSIYNALGKEVSVLVNKQLLPGTYEFTFDASEFTSGIYFYKLTAGDFTETKKMLMIK
jgi:hypothetical protein